MYTARLGRVWATVIIAAVTCPTIHDRKSETPIDNQTFTRICPAVLSKTYGNSGTEIRATGEPDERRLSLSLSH
jgi:hypothetical protein